MGFTLEGKSKSPQVEHKEKIMKFLFLLAMKNLFRYTKRTLITASAIAFGIILTLFVDGILRWADDNSIQNLLNFETASLRIESQEYFNEAEYLPLKKTLPHGEAIKTLLQKEGVDYAEETRFLSTVVNPETGESYNFVGIGIEPSKMKKVYRFQEHIVSGAFLNKKPNSIFISSYLSKLLNRKVGDEIVIEANTVNDMHNADSFVISGIFDSPNPAVDKKNYYISFESANRLLDMENKFTALSIHTPHISRTFKKLKKLISFDDVLVLRWQDLAKDYSTLSETKKGSTKSLLFFVFILAAVGIINTMLMAIFERKQEIGMLRSLGMQKKEITYTFIFESAGIGFIGSLFGVIFGTAVNGIFAAVGIDYGPILGDMDYGYRVPAVFHTQINLNTIIVVFVFGILISVLISLYPALKASSLNIVDSLRE